MNLTPPPSLPAISVVIPMYNAEKYISACLETILNQTFQNFEVIVVDDCSTDDSCAVVESYVGRFGGRLKLSKMQKNSGGPGEPSNHGVNLSRGKYVYIMDNDDLIVNQALEILYNYAESFNAEVVNSGRVIEFTSEAPFPSTEKMAVRNWYGEISTAPTLETENLNERMQKYLNIGVMVPAWAKLVLRDFLIENKITFPKLGSSADCVWTFEIFCLAKKFLQIPQPFYIYRHRPSSVTHSNRDQRKVNFWNEILVKGVKILSDFMSKQEFFKENPQYQFAVMNKFATGSFRQAVNGYLNISAPEMYIDLKMQLQKNLGENSDLIAYLCTAFGVCDLNLKIANQRILELENKLRQLQGG